MDKKELFDAIYKELELADFLGKKNEHYYYITGVVGAALSRLESANNETEKEKRLL